MLTRFNELLAEVPRDSGALIITGRDGLFSGGFDLKTLATGDMEKIQKMVTLGYKTLLDLYGFDRPIFGHGPKMFRIKCKEKKYQIGINPCQTHPHNFYIQLLAETGIVGFGFLFAVFSYIIYVSYRQIKSIILKQKRYLTDYQVCLLAGILITFMSSFRKPLDRRRSETITNYKLFTLKNVINKNSR